MDQRWLLQTCLLLSGVTLLCVLNSDSSPGSATEQSLPARRPLSIEATSPSPEPAPPAAAANVSPPAAEEAPELTGTLICQDYNRAILRYKGNIRIIAEGGRIGPYTVGGVYPRRATVKGPDGHKVTLGLQMEAAPQVPAAPARPSLKVTQVMRGGKVCGVMLRGPQGENPLAPYGVCDSDIVRSVNGRPLQTDQDTPWLSAELQSGRRLDFGIERFGNESVLSYAGARP